MGLFSAQDKGKWKQNVGAAKAQWGKLTEDELMQTEGNAERLAGKIQEKYGVAKDEAKKQADDFLSKIKH
jgi:uncharacterized protein YjbJ (UPF0337 family)